jgi:uncharacterized protein YuzE
MRVEHDPQTDTLTITLRDGRIRESDEVRPGVIPKSAFIWTFGQPRRFRRSQTDATAANPDTRTIVHNIWAIGIIADFGDDGGVVRFEVLDASKVVGRTREMQFALAGG